MAWSTRPLTAWDHAAPVRELLRTGRTRQGHTSSILGSDRDIPDSSDAPNAEPRSLVVEMAELVGGLAHELRNPLSTMMVNLKLLTEDLNDIGLHPEDARRRALLKVDVLRREAERLQNLFDKFLNLTDPYCLERAEADVNAIITRLVEFFEPSAKDSRITLNVVLANDPLPCRVDEKLLRQALLNMVINAQQAMPNGGTLHITTEADGDMVVIKLSDTGIGIAGQDRERILRPFFSTKAGGNGLGLSITQRIISEHGGVLDFESEPGRGTTFTIRLPCNLVDSRADGSTR
jgi:signal transduction histidine kinase